MTTQTNTVAANTANERESARAIDKAISTIRKTGVAFLALVQDTIVAIIEHSNVHGDCTRAANLVDAMPKNGMRRAGAIQHFKLYGGINVSTNGKTGLMRATRQRDDTGGLVQGDLDKARAINWFDNKSAQDTLITFDLEQALTKVDNLVAFVTKRLEMTQKDKDGNDLLAKNSKGEMAPVLVVTDELERQRLRDLANTLKGVEKKFHNPIAAPVTGTATVEPEVQTSLAA